MYWVGVDVGGTFTDVVLCDSGVSRLTKTPSTPADQSEGIVRGVSALGIEPQGIVRFGHGSTVATNTAQERNGARTAVLVTRGHRDVGLAPSVVGDMIDAVRTLHGRGLTFCSSNRTWASPPHWPTMRTFLQGGRIAHSGPAAGLLDSEDVLRCYLG